MLGIARNDRNGSFADILCERCSIVPGLLPYELSVPPPVGTKATDRQTRSLFDVEPSADDPQLWSISTLVNALGVGENAASKDTNAYLINLLDAPHQRGNRLF
jgi:hypothetical protein